MIKQSLLVMLMAGNLAFCDTAEERAEAHFRSGMELLEAGDADRALVEFRNVFKLDGQHREARRTYARVVRERGDLREAFGQYLRLVEQYPDDLEGRRALAEMALQAGDWQAARSHAEAVAQAGDPVVGAVLANIAYRDAVVAQDAAAQAAAVARAQTILASAEADADFLLAQRVVIDDLLRREDWPGALAAIDAAQERAPQERAFYPLRLGVLARMGEDRMIQAQLEEMAERFPDDPTIPATLVRWHVARGETEAAEAVLRARSEARPDDTGAAIDLLRFLTEVRGREVARAEVERLLAGDPPAAARLQALRAGIDFDLGQRDAAIAEMEGIIRGLEPTDERRNIQLALARMLEMTGNRVGARALVEEILAQDPAHVEALKLRAGWLIEGDRADEALVALRGALAQSPNDAGVMTLMARAHERAGNRDLMAEMLARAVEASNRAPEESLRYAAHLLGAAQYRPAEDVLIGALRLAPSDVRLLATLGQVYVGMQDWPRLEQVADTLRRIGTPEAERSADDLTARRLAAQNREEDLMAFLEGLSRGGEGSAAAAAAIIRTRLAGGDQEGALAYARQMVAENPGNPALRFVLASTLAVGQDFDEAGTILRELAQASPRSEQIWLALYNLERSRGSAEAARAVLGEGLAAVPGSGRLSWAMAGEHERAGEIDAAIAIYETLYERDSANMIVANNLASLLSGHREDAETLERAFAIARRLRGVPVPAFQDTYGWLAFRRGDLDAALAHLEPAAAGLPGDPRVQYHLGVTYAALGRDAEALAQFRKVAEMTDPARPPEYLAAVEAEIARLSAAPAGAEGGAQGQN
ncbi:MAG: hypothetical protein CVT80_01815 [Alphaproteobacteria bacterium HGW-Alphaproteobacteria-2]|nr:MAG: hypothetical protein CVT80_01815 [Alphaproteobacteria bacterium HGW-Alphaproteobacteria-2]